MQNAVKVKNIFDNIQHFARPHFLESRGHTWQISSKYASVMISLGKYHFGA